jgi:hypothetical protein
MAQVLPDRFCILGAGAAGAVLAFSLGQAGPAAWQRGIWRRGVPATIAVLAVTGETSWLGRYLTGLRGRPAFRVGRVVAWPR